MWAAPRAAPGSRSGMYGWAFAPTLARPPSVWTRRPWPSRGGDLNGLRRAVGPDALFRAIPGALCWAGILRALGPPNVITLRTGSDATLAPIAAEFVAMGALATGRDGSPHRSTGRLLSRALAGPIPRDERHAFPSPLVPVFRRPPHARRGGSRGELAGLARAESRRWERVSLLSSENRALRYLSGGVVGDA